MPDPNNYESESEWMSACVPVRVSEGDDNDQAVAVCMNMWRNKGKAMTNELKAISKDDKEYRAGNYIVLFGGRDLTAFRYLGNTNPKYRNADGSAGEFFSKNVKLDSDYTELGKVPINWEHGTQELPKDDVLGYVDWKTAKADEQGIFVERVLYRHKKYVQWLETLIDAGLVGTSSEVVPNKAVVKENGEIIEWPIKRDTLTVMPMEPRMKSENVLQAYKSLGILDVESNGEEPPETEEKAIEEPDKTKETNNMEEKDFKAMLDENTQSFKAMLEESQATVMEKVTEQAETAAQKAVEDVLDKLPEVKAKMNGETIEVTKDEGDKEFKSIGENCIAVYKHTKGLSTHPRIRGLQAKAIAFAEADGDEAALEAAYKAALGSNEGIPSQGEFLLEPTVTQTLLKPMHETGVFSTKVNRLPVGPNSNSGWIPGVDETSRANGSRWGGVRGYHSAEAATMTASQPKFRRINWELHKVYVLQYATDELLRDAGMLTAIINQSSAEELDFMVNDDILNGVGGDRPLGVLNAGNLISVARYATSQVNWIDPVTMWQRMHPRFKGGAAWYVNSEVMPELDRLAAVSHAGTTEMPPRFVDYDSNGVMRIKGKPVYETEFNAALGTAGDILLANMGEFLFWEKGAIEAAMSIHVQFLTDQTAFRFISRYDGQAADASAITPYKGSNTQSPFVVLSASTS